MTFDPHNTTGKYILDEYGNPVPEPDLYKWAMWLEHSHLSSGKDNRIVQQDFIDGIKISTVFLGLDQNLLGLRGQGPPILWETMIFGGLHDCYMARYTSREEAVLGHAEALQMIEAAAKDVRELDRMLALEGSWHTKL